MKKLVSLLTLVVGLGLSTLAFAAAELVDPAPVAVPAGISEKSVVKHIKKAFVGRNWMIEEEEKGKITASVRVRSHTARIAAVYNNKQVQFTYVSSDNLAYKEKNGKRYIHKNYLNWVENVRSDLSKGLQLEALEKAN
ncbi:hypothetical protein DWB84_14640 [Saccharophagus sp. K07]|jgi:creatinine amidohydrolase/Fe(II)-dependent formamide hydrolase-like protein|uniref:hypothetical protein n=1 Tax=Saccharophagus sp. K07 TaxID=2283636 RepID=UPI00165244DC|nr:hypothetical protein [Saccharophagus sp. K07]MBC6906687.1 hypothetical protein [Saccharophagus sp. K07]